MKPKRYWSRNKMHKINPELVGVYLLFHHGKVVYIGQTAALYSRLVFHYKKDWTKFRIIPCYDQIRRREWETRLLNKFRPKYNIQIPSIIKSRWYIEKMEMIRFFREQEKVA